MKKIYIAIDKSSPRRKRFWILGIFLTVLSVLGTVIYFNFNNLLSAALMSSFNNNIVSDVYELKFEKLRINFLQGDIKVSNVILQPRNKHLNSYPYINSSFRLTAEKLVLKNVEIIDLIQFNKLKLDKIKIEEPQIDLFLEGQNPILFPFKDSSTVSSETTGAKKTIDSFHLEKFELVDAGFHVISKFRQQEFNISNLNFIFNDLYLSQHYGIDSLQCNSIFLTIDSANGSSLQTTIKQFQLKEFRFNLDKLYLQKSIKHVNYKFEDFTTALKDLLIQTEDSIYQITAELFALSYKEKNIVLNNVQFAPNISESALQKLFNYQHSQFKITINKMVMNGIDFDTLLVTKAINIKEIIVDSAVVAVFRDKTKPVDPARFPEYPPQQLQKIKFPLSIQNVVVTNATILNRERKVDGRYAKVKVTRLKGTIENVSTISDSSSLNLAAEGYIEDEAQFKISLKMDYSVPQFSINGSVAKFELGKLNPLIKNYSPARINSGIIDQVEFSGIAYKTKSFGTMKFLYHDLNIDLQLKEQPKWKSDLGAFAANTYLQGSNPANDNLPPRVVRYEAERDMHKGFINIILKSVFSGVRETLILSKENRKRFQETKKEWKQKQKDLQSQ